MAEATFHGTVQERLDLVVALHRHHCEGEECPHRPFEALTQEQMDHLLYVRRTVDRLKAKEFKED